jgi:hypothetical protein
MINNSFIETLSGVWMSLKTFNMYIQEVEMDVSMKWMYLLIRETYYFRIIHSYRRMISI